MKRTIIIAIVLIFASISLVFFYSQNLSNIELFKKSQDSKESSNYINSSVLKDMIIGDDLFGMTIQECVITDEGFKQIIFNGEFTISGELRINTIGDSKYVIICNFDEVFNTLPHMKSWDMDFMRYYPFEIKDNSKKLDNFIDGTIAEELLKDEGKRYIITVLCSSFNYEYNAKEDLMSKINIKDIVSIEEMRDVEDNVLFFSEIDFEEVKVNIVVAKVIDIKGNGVIIIEDVNGGSIMRKTEYDAYETIKQLRPWRRYSLQLQDTTMSEEYKVGDLIQLSGVYNQETNTIIQTDDHSVMVRYKESF